MASENALHEAAHCLAAVRHGIRVHRVSIDECEIEGPGDCLEKGHHHGAVAVGYAIVALAGQAAAPKSGMSGADRLLLANAFFLASFADNPDEMRRALSDLAERFVLEHRDEIERLAEVLDERRIMSAVEVEEVIGRGQ